MQFATNLTKCVAWVSICHMNQERHLVRNSARIIFSSIRTSKCRLAYYPIFCRMLGQMSSTSRQRVCCRLVSVSFLSKITSESRECRCVPYIQAQHHHEKPMLLITEASNLLSTTVRSSLRGQSHQKNFILHK